MTDEEMYRLIAEINSAFTPSAPSNSRDLFAGRRREIEKAIGTVCQPGQHAVIYGERGVGKTSLANILFDLLVYMGRDNYQRARLNCCEGMPFEQIWRGIFKQLTSNVDGEDNPSSVIPRRVPAGPNSFPCYRPPLLLR